MIDTLHDIFIASLYIFGIVFVGITIINMIKPTKKDEKDEEN